MLQSIPCMSTSDSIDCWRLNIGSVILSTLARSESEFLSLIRGAEHPKSATLSRKSAPCRWSSTDHAVSAMSVKTVYCAVLPCSRGTPCNIESCSVSGVPRGTFEYRSSVAMGKSCKLSHEGWWEIILDLVTGSRLESGCRGPSCAISSRATRLRRTSSS